jgi:pimeloyl-ACP methyl ester carboxylesterase
VIWLDELFSVLELGNSIKLVGMSYGGWLTGQYALRLQNRLDKIVLVAPAATVIRLQLEFLVRLLFSLVPYRCFTESMMHWLAADLARKGEDGRRMVEAAVDAMFTARRCFRPRHLVLPTVLGDEEWQKIRVPTLYLVGENEKIYSARRAVQRLKEVATHVQAEIIPNAGHDLTFVQVEMVNSKILEFLEQP